MAIGKGKGGKREGAGRKPKVQEVKLVESMDAISVPDEIWRALLYKCQQGDTGALKLWLSYRYGLPRQQVDITTNGESIAPPISWLNKEIEFRDIDTIDYDPVDSIKIGIQSLEDQEDI